MDQLVRLNGPPQTHAFMQLVLSEPALQARLGCIVQGERFEAEACAIAAEFSTPLTMEDARSLTAPLGLRGSSRHTAPIEMSTWPAIGWIPMRTVSTGDDIMFDWLWMGEAKTDAPFFETSAAQANAMPFNRAFRIRTNLETLITGGKSANPVPLSGLVYHMSRCGSTLLGRILGALPDHLVASEPEPLDAIVRWAETSNASHHEKLEAIRAIVAALGRRRNPAWQRFFIKCDAWNILSFPLLRDAFPDVPWVFLHRDPIEVLVSLARQPGLQTVPGMLPDAIVKIDDVGSLAPDEYGAMLLAKLCKAATEHVTDGGMVVEYTDLIPAALDDVPHHFGFTPDAAQQAEMKTASQADAKNPSANFMVDSATKQSSANLRIQELAQIHLMELTERLRALHHM